MVLDYYESAGEEVMQFSGEAATRIVLQVCCAANYLHGRNIIHRDLKLQNLLFDSLGNARVCDLGFARFVDENQMTQLGTPRYMAPEIFDMTLAEQLFMETNQDLSLSKYDDSADVWSIGVMAYVLLSGKFPFEGKTSAMHRLQRAGNVNWQAI